MWVDAIRSDDVHVRVMLQTFDHDTGSKNEHVLFDRLSIGIVPERIVDSRWLHDTGLELPLEPSALDDLVGMLGELRA